MLCLDVGPSMVDPDNGTPLKTSIKIINQIIQQKVMTQPIMRNVYYMTSADVYREQG